MELLIRDAGEINEIPIPECFIKFPQRMIGFAVLCTTLPYGRADVDKRVCRMNTIFGVEFLKECGNCFCNKSFPSHMKESDDVSIRIIGKDWLTIRRANHKKELFLIGEESVSRRSTFHRFPHNDHPISAYLEHRCAAPISCYAFNIGIRSYMIFFVQKIDIKSSLELPEKRGRV